MKALILYPELAAYNIPCFEALTAFDEVHIVAYPVNAEAPFIFETSDRVIIHSRNDYDLDDLKKLAKDLDPNLVFCAGWIDKDYMTIANEAESATTLLGFDNQWNGGWRQRAGILVKGKALAKTFDYAFVPGIQQEEFAQRLGFSNERIILGAYSCDYKRFAALAAKNAAQKEASFPKRFIYVGRYIERKGIYDMWEAFIELQQEESSDWELWCLGAGELYEQRTLHPKIKHYGFVQPDKMEQFVAETGVFILPSHFEPWGVAVHEYAAAGFPMILSNEIGAGTAFLEDGKNGFAFPSSDKPALKKAMKKVMDMPMDQLQKMGLHSIELAKKITPQKWAASLTAICK